MLPRADAASREAQPRGVCRVSRPRISPRLPAAGLLVLLALREGFGLLHGSDPLQRAPFALASLALGGCLWWVAHRQVGWRGALAALALFVLSPVGSPGTSSFAAAPVSLGLFSMLYTAVGVAHALQGPRSKWPPRIVMMAGLTAFTAWIAPPAAFAALLLSAAAMLYLAEERRGLVAPLLLGWGVMAALVGLLRSNLTAVLPHWLDAGLPLSFAPPSQSYVSGFLSANAGVLLALLPALCLWSISRHSRYFGNTAPLVAGCSLALLSVPVIGGPSAHWGWILPFALLFIAGTYADGFDTRGKRFWQFATAVSIVVQLATALRV